MAKKPTGSKGAATTRRSAAKASETTRAGTTPSTPEPSTTPETPVTSVAALWQPQEPTPPVQDQQVSGAGTVDKALGDRSGPDSGVDDEAIAPLSSTETPVEVPARSEQTETAQTVSVTAETATTDQLTISTALGVERGIGEDVSEVAPPDQSPPTVTTPGLVAELGTEVGEALAPPASPPVLSEAEPEPLPVSEVLSEPEHRPESPIAPPAPSRPSLFIVQISPELATVAKVGGLADVVFGLSRELAIRGNHVEIILPKYATLRYDQIYELHEVYRDLWVPWYDGAIHCTVFFGFVHGRKCFFIEPHSQDNFFNRGSIYGFRDDVLRYAFFSRAALEFLWKAGKHPDVIHCHDWQTALVPVLLYEFYQALGMTHPRVCLTIHNFAHQGLTGIELLHATGLHRPERFFDQTRLGDNHHHRALNLLKGGVVYSNFVTTVSPRYAHEAKDLGQGFGLEPTLHTHQVKYGGVVNGIDYDVWNPEIDPHIPVRYGVDSIDGKYDNKRALRHRLMLADNEKPIVAFIGRLDPQKGLELVRHAIFYTLERGAQFVLLGSSPNDAINADFWGLKRMLNDSPDCHLEIGFDEDLSHLIYAGADMMLVPSRFEPCGLTQLIALRYGTIPVVRAVGGLVDTVFDKDHSERPLHQRNGYVFRDYDNPGLESALGRAIACYSNYPEHFRELMKNAMRSDYSWNIPGQDYLNIYDLIREK